MYLKGFIPKGQLTPAFCSAVKRMINVALIMVQYYACMY